jgi:UDP-N-acetylenolpyruvoylglucosamine reductase
MTPPNPILEKLKARLPHALVLQNEPLAKKTTLRVGGCADVYVEPASEDDLAQIIQVCREGKVPFMLLGRGSNLLIRDRGVRGVVICLAHSAFSAIEINQCDLRCGAGARLKAVATKARELNLGGLEFLEGIPGSVGGALRMNAGAMQGWTMEVVESVRSIDLLGQVHEVKKAEMEIHYRNVPHFQSHIAVSARLKGTPSAKHEINEKLKAFSNKRWTSQPAAPSAGCIFKNPGPIPAGQLIHDLGQ